MHTSGPARVKSRKEAPAGGWTAPDSCRAGCPTVGVRLDQHSVRLDPHLTRSVLRPLPVSAPGPPKPPRQIQQNNREQVTRSAMFHRCPMVLQQSLRVFIKCYLNEKGCNSFPTTFLVRALADNSLAIWLQSYTELSFPITFSFFPFTKHSLSHDDDCLGLLIHLTSVFVEDKTQDLL